MKSRGHQGISNSEFAVLSALWDANKPLPRPEILERMPEIDWNPNSIHLVLNGLIEKGYVRIDGIVRCGQSYGRTYAATISRMEYAAQQANKAFENLPANERTMALVSAIVDANKVSEETLLKLEKMLEEKRSALKTGADD